MKKKEMNFQQDKRRMTLVVYKVSFAFFKKGELGKCK